MPLLKKWNTDEAFWGIWKVTETNEELMSMLTGKSCRKEVLLSYKSDARRTEYLAVRVLLKTVAGEEYDIMHEESGKPYIKDRKYNITISHTKGYVAVGVSSVSEPGIDIEYYSERVMKVTSKFMSDSESSFINKSSEQRFTHVYMALLVWSAKETMFKMLGESEVDFIDHLCISPFRIVADNVAKSSGKIGACEYKSKFKRNIIIDYITDPEFVCTYSCIKK